YFPTARQILPVEDLSNPLNTVIGNPDLSPNRGHNVQFSFRDYDYASKSGYNIYAGGEFSDNSVTISTVFDESRRGTTTYENVAGNNSFWFGGYWNKSFKRDAHTFRVTLGVNSSYDRDQGFVNAELYDARSVSLTPRVTFMYSYGELLTINPSYSFTNSSTTYENYVIDHASNLMHRAGVQVTSYWPKNFVIGTDLNYTHNSNIADGFKKDFYLMNVSLGYNFLKDAFTARVKVYDLLDQNQNATRTIGATSITDQENTVLKRYVMFSLSYKFNKFGAVKADKPERRSH